MNKFKIFCNLLENIKSPKEARGQISEYLSKLDKNDQIIACNFLLGSPLENEAIGYKTKTIQKVIDTYYDYDKSKKYETLGDMFSGELDINYNGDDLKLVKIHKLFSQLSNNTKNKEDCLRYMLVIMDDLEKKYFVNILLNKLRVRIGMGVISHSIAEIYDVDQKYVNNLYKKYESITDVIGILNGGSDELVIGIPVKPQLAKDISKHMDRIEYPVYAEPKYDGSRAQVHVHENGNIQIFSRSLKDKTDSFPDIVELLREKNILPGIYDGEIYGVNSDGSLMSFNKYQHRINNVKSININDYPITIRLFDVLMFDESDYTNESQDSRTSLLNTIFPNLVTTSKIIPSENKLLEYHKECIEAGYEGVMIKNREGTYDCGRGKSEWGNWYKLKTSIIRCDVIITGATFGSGSNVSLLSSFEISVLDDTSNIDNYPTEGSQINLKSVGNCGSGFDQATLKLFTERIMKTCDKIEDYSCFDDPIIIEISPQEITRNESGGIGFRFPIFEGFREDKKIEDIDTVSMVSQYIE